MTIAKRVKKPVYLEVPGLDRKMTVIEECPDGQQILWRKPYGDLPFDGYLEYVIAFWHDKFVVWYWNHQCGGFGNGHYFPVFQYEGSERPHVDALLDALKYFDSVGPKTNIGERMTRYVTAHQGQED